MKKIVAAVMALFLAQGAYADRASLIEYTDNWNLFTNFELGYSKLADRSTMLGGLAIGGLLNDTFGLGVAGVANLNSIKSDDSPQVEIGLGDFWYIGLYTEYVFGMENLVYFSIDLLVGGGQVSPESAFGNLESSNVYAIEPGINLMINITETFMFGLGVSYRFIGNVDSPGLEDSDLSGLTGTAFFRFTQF